MKSINPTSGEVVLQYEAHSDQGAERIVSSVAKAWHSWKHVSFEQRSTALLNLAGLLRTQRDELARLITLEMGKVYHESQAEIEKCAWVCEYYALNGEAFLMNEPVATQYTASYVGFKPLGVILAVMPWNFPFWQVFRAAAPALMAGNTMVLKHEELERSKKYDMIDRILTGVDITVKVTAIVVPMVKYDQWFHEGMKFEETGTFVAQTFKSFFGKMKPTM